MRFWGKDSSSGVHVSIAKRGTWMQWDLQLHRHALITTFLVYRDFGALSRMRSAIFHVMPNQRFWGVLSKLEQQHASPAKSLSLPDINTESPSELLALLSTYEHRMQECSSQFDESINRHPRRFSFTCRRRLFSHNTYAGRSSQKIQPSLGQNTKTERNKIY